MARKKLDVTVSLSIGVVRKLDRLAKVQRVSRSAAIEDILVEGLAEADDFVRVMSNDKVRTAMFEALGKPGVVRAIATSLGQELTPADGQKVLQFFKAAGMVATPPSGGNV
jgi:hypothetical protein